MGDHADDALGMVVDAGVMGRRDHGVTCRHCGAVVYWRKYAVGWRTTEWGEMHKCPAFAKRDNTTQEG